MASVAVDEQGALLVANSEGGVIDVFKGKDGAPTRVIKTGQRNSHMFAFERSEDALYVSDVRAALGQGGRTRLWPRIRQRQTATDVTRVPRAPDFLSTGVAVTPSAPF